MNTKTFNKILTFYHEGVSEETCIAIILDKMKDESKPDIAYTIHKFYTTIYKDRVEKIYVPSTEGRIA